MNPLGINSLKKSFQTNFELYELNSYKIDNTFDRKIQPNISSIQDLTNRENNFSSQLHETFDSTSINTGVRWKNTYKYNRIPNLLSQYCSKQDNPNYLHIKIKKNHPISLKEKNFYSRTFASRFENNTKRLLNRRKYLLIYNKFLTSKNKFDINLIFQEVKKTKKKIFINSIFKTNKSVEPFKKKKTDWDHTKYKSWTQVLSRNKFSDLSINNPTLGRIFFIPQIFYEIPFSAPPNFSVQLKIKKEFGLAKKKTIFD